MDSVRPGAADQLFDLVTEHRGAQDPRRDHAGAEWHERGWIVTRLNGKPTDPRRDLSARKALLREAGAVTQEPGTSPRSTH